MRQHLPSAERDIGDDRLEHELEPRLGCAVNWATRLLAPEQRTIIASSFNATEWDRLDYDTRQALRDLVGRLGESWDLDELTALVYAVPKRMLGVASDAEPTPEIKKAQREFFKVMYRLLCNSDTGPRLPTLLLSIGLDRSRHLLSDGTPSGAALRASDESELRAVSFASRVRPWARAARTESRWWVLMSRDAVVEHYSHGALEQRILEALTVMGADPEHLEHDQLAPVDEFHVGGRSATVELVDQLDLRPGLRVLDIGSGLGGTARYLAAWHGVEVTGIDLTQEYVAVASSLTRRAGLAERAKFRQGTATDLPFPDATFDRACMVHVGMNIADKAAAFREVRRVLVDGGCFGVYDIMGDGSGEISYPVPWAATAETSFLAQPQRYRELLAAAGLTVVAERDRHEFGLGFLREMLATIAESGPPPLGLHIVMGQDAGVKIANMVANLERYVVAPVELICAAR